MFIALNKKFPFRSVRSDMSHRAPDGAQNLFLVTKGYKHCAPPERYLMILLLSAGINRQVVLNESFKR